MKTKDEAKDLTLIQLFDRFGTDDKARQHLESVLWKDGIVCPHCQCNDKAKFSDIAANPDKKIRAGLRWCSNCQKQFTVTIGTIFEDSHIPLRKWLIAWYLICSSKKGISSLQLQRLLELGSYRTALFLSHRIRHGLRDLKPEKLDGVVEADEIEIGGRYRGKAGRRTPNKTPVIAMVQRGGEMRAKVLPTIHGANLRQAIRDNVKAGSQVHTDGAFSFKKLAGEYDHKSVKHAAQEYSRREGDTLISTGAVEGFFSLLKRGVVGTFHHLSRQHLPLYLAEFEHRHNCRKMSDGERTDLGLTKVIGKRLIYKNQ